MNRTQISLTDEDRRLLDTAAASTGRSLSALIRDAVRARYGAGAGLDEAEVLSRAIGSWEDRGFDSVEYVDRLRSGRRLDDVR